MIQKIKFYLVSVLSVAVLCGFLGGTTAAFSLFDKACDGNGAAAVCKDSQNAGNPIYGSGGVISVVVDILSLVVGIAAVIVIIVAGIQYMLSTGDPTKTNNSKNAILYAVAGLVIAVFARFIVTFIVGKL